MSYVGKPIVHKFLPTRAGTINDPNQWHSFSASHLRHVEFLFGVDHAMRTSLHGEIFGDDRRKAPSDLPKTANDTIGRRDIFCPLRKLADMRAKLAVFLKCPSIQQ